MSSKSENISEKKNKFCISISLYSIYNAESKSTDRDHMSYNVRGIKLSSTFDIHVEPLHTTRLLINTMCCRCHQLTLLVHLAEKKRL